MELINVVRNRGYEVVYIRFGIVRLGLLRSTNTIQANEKNRGKKKKKKKKKEKKSALQDMAVISASQPQGTSWRQEIQSLVTLFSQLIYYHIPNEDNHV